MWDLFYSRALRCSEFEKKKVVNINMLSIVLNYLTQILEMCAINFEKLSFTSRFAVLIVFAFGLCFSVVVVILMLRKRFKNVLRKIF